MGVKKEYLKEIVNTVMRIDPTLDKDEVKKMAASIMKEHLKDPTIIADNNVTGAHGEMTLTDLCQWIDVNNPVISGNATFYCQPEELESPTSNMLRTLKKERKSVKNEMYGFNPYSDEYALLDLSQQNKKVIMNAEYGGSGTPTAAFYTKYSPAATTLMAQSIITTMAAFFESFVGDNQKFFHVNECFDWMNKIIKKDKKIPKWVMRVTPKEVQNRILNHFYMLDMNDIPVINAYIDHCTEDELVYLYYANNLREFIGRHIKVSNLIRNILDSLPRYEAVIENIPVEFEGQFEDDEINKAVDKYNKWVSKEMFLDPYTIPNIIKPYMDELRDILTQFIYVEYITPDSIVKLNNHKRNTVLLVDTDSNVINADIFVGYITKRILPGEKFGRSSLYNEMILVNVLASMLDSCVASMLDYYGRCHNMGPEARKELTMKNEFMFRRFFIMKTKKRYASSIALREGNIMMPLKLEIKGMDFIKAGVSDEVTKRFTDMLKNHVLYSDNIELHELMKDLKAFESEIYNSLRRGETTYLKSQQYKAEGAYKVIKDSNGRVLGTKAWSLPVFRGAAVWNELYPDQKINSLDRVSICKLIVTSPDDLMKIRDKFPKEYDMLMEKVYGSTSENIKKAGLKVLSLPNTLKKMPNWLIPLIDYDIIISDIISSFRSVLDALNIEEMYFKTANGNANVTTCLIAI